MSNSPAGKGDRNRGDPQKYNEGLKGISGFSWSDMPLAPTDGTSVKWKCPEGFDMLIDNGAIVPDPSKWARIPHDWIGR